jgi:hypothetical protein
MEGFYKYIENEKALLHAPNFVSSPNYSLQKAEKENYSYPVDGWYWFDSENQAKKFFGVPNETPSPDSPDVTNKYVITAPKTLIAMYPELLFDLAVRRKLPIEESGDYILIYCNWIDPNHQTMIDNSNGMITISEN